MSQTHATPDITQILRDAKIIAIIGASSDPGRPSNSIMAYLQRAGYKTIPVNPNETEILGEPAYKSLADIPASTKVDIVNVFRRPAATPDVARAAIARGDAKTLWLQTGVVNDEAMALAQGAGMNAIQNSCIAVLHRLYK